MTLAPIALHNVSAAALSELLGFDVEDFDVTYKRGGIPSAAYVFFGEGSSCVKAILHPQDYSPAIGSPATRGAAQWALRSPCRQATINWDGRVLALEDQDIPF